MPGSNDNIIVLESDDDDEALSGDKDDVVFVDMTPVRVRPSRVKNLNLMPISIDSDDEDEDDDDIIFVSATTGKRKSRMGSTRTLPSPSIPVSDQALLNVLESIDNPSGLTASQSLPQDLLASSDTEHSTSLLLGTPKLPPGQPSFHDSSNYVDDTDGPSHLGRMRSGQNDPGRLSALDPDSTLSAFLAGDTTPPAVDNKSSLGTWPDTSSEQQGLLAWLSNISVPSNLGLDDESTKANAGDQAGTTVAGSTASPNPTSSPLSSFQKVDSWLSTMPSASKLDDRKVVTAPDPLASNPASPWLSYLSPSGQVTSASLDTNTTSSPSGLTSLVTSLLSTVSDAFQSPVLQTAGVHTSTTDSAGAPRPTPRTNSSSNDSHGGGAAAKDSTNTSPNESFTSSSLTSSPSSLSTVTLSSVQSSGATSPSSPRARISLRPHASVTRNPPLSPPVTTINLTGESSSPPRPQLGRSSSSITPSSDTKAGGTVKTVAPIVICPQSDDDTTTSSTANPHMATSSQEVTSTTHAPTASRSSSHTNFTTDTSVAKPSPSTPETGASSSSLLKRSVSYMQTHPNNIPLKKRRRQRAVGRLSLDSVDTRGGGSGTAGSGGGGENTDSRKCSWCQLMVSYSQLSHCMEGHPCCADCLQLRAKALLSKAKRGSLKCPYASCVSYFPMSQLQRTLPSMVVEILEEKLDQEYIKYADDLMWQNLGEGATGADGDGTLADDEEEEEEEDEDDAGTGGDRGSRPSIPKQPSLSTLPVFWEQMDDVSSGFKMVELSSDNIEYTEISCLFNSTMKNQATIQRICRVQNPILWQFYNVKKLQLQEAGGEPVQEKQLCHGTSNNVVDAICKNNFDWRLCGAHGTMYGQGTYFARDASYSHVYTDNVRTRSLQNPGHILAMLNKTKKVRSHICLKHLAGQQSVNTGAGGGWPGMMQPGMHNQPPPAHWKQPPQVSVSLINMAQSPVISQSQAVSNQSLLVSQTNSTSIMSSIVQSGAAVALGMSVLGPTVGSTSTGNSGLNLSMRPLTISTTPSSLVHKPPSFHRLLHTQPAQPPPAHLRRAHQHSAGGSGAPGSGTCSGHRSMAHYYNKRRSLFSTATEVPLSPQKRPIHSMFIAKVLVGRYTNGHNHYRKPPPVDHNDPYGRAYDSCVDDMRDPKIYVIFDSAQSYPEYLIEYHSNSSYM